MIEFAHVGGVPVEELLPAVAGPGGMLLLGRAWLSVHLRRLGPRQDAAERDAPPHRT